MKLSIIIPIYNEKDTLHTIIERVEDVDLPIEKEIILVDDCSSDGTRDLLKDLEKNYRVFYHAKNGGKGRALRTGLSKATGDILVIQDADLEYDPQDWKKMLPLILKGKTQIVYGSRFLHQPFFSKQKWAIPTHYIGNKFLSFVTSILYFYWLTDMETCYKLFTRKAYESITLRSQRFDFEPEITSKFLKKGFKIVEVPISYNARSFEEGKKISWRDGITALYFLFFYRFFN